MNRINELFAAKSSSILSVYFTAGYPQLSSTEEVIRQLSNKGVDMIEIGIPFSDLLADGPVIQNSSRVALQNGMTQRLLFEQLKNVRKITNIPLILMGYINPILQLGFEEFCRQAQSVGIDGFIVPDLPMSEYLRDFQPIARRYGLENILLITPETPDERIRLIDEHSNGFIYMVSSASTTGMQSSFSEEKEKYFKRIQDMKLKNPTLVGFGISNKETFDSACRFSRGAIIGSALVKALGDSASVEQAVDKLLADIGILG
ncbi:MAG: tryptophan synthase subunit alpha [Prevotellaceae bacterium]|jgi:tryptophan synthase alpha chain|nr:tryptophan synthase subunit alpha [Prevotellaceae bacterium]